MKKDLKMFYLLIGVLVLGFYWSSIGDEETLEESIKEESIQKDVKEDKYILNPENLEKAIHKTLGKSTNQNKNRIVKVEITDTNYVHLYINTDRTLYANTVLKDANKVFNELQKFKEAEQMNVFWYATGIDDKGNESEVEIVKTGFTKQALEGINFKEFPIESYDKYASIYFIHPAWQWK